MLCLFSEEELGKDFGFFAYCFHNNRNLNQFLHFEMKLCSLALVVIEDKIKKAWKA